MQQERRLNVWLIISVLACLAFWGGVGVTLFAQTSTVPGDRIGWDQPAASPEEANSYQYRFSLDGGPATVAAGVTCTGAASPYTCVGNFPATTPGQHSLVIVARRIVDATTFLDSAPSAAFVFRLEVVPGTPANLRRVIGG